MTAPPLPGTVAGSGVPTHLEVTDVTVGSGAQAADGKKLTIHYTGTLQSGAKFASSRDSGKPFTFTLGSDAVVQGFNLGFRGMKEGGHRRLIIPPALAYGDRAAGGVPANSVLLYDFELIKVE